jgi:hypothetical protein
MIKYLAIALVIVALITIGVHRIITAPVESSIDYEPINALNEPEQTDLTDATPIVHRANNTNLIYTPVAEYRIPARVLSKHAYRGDWSSQIAPYDFALGWGNCADKEYMKGIKIDQMQRFYFYNASQKDYYKLGYIGLHSANNHVIPATKNLRHLVGRIKRGDMVVMEGYLVRVSGSVKGGQVSWGTSTSRDDTGNGACEVIYVHTIKHKGKVYH